MPVYWKRKREDLDSSSGSSSPSLENRCKDATPHAPQRPRHEYSAKLPIEESSVQVKRLRPSRWHAQAHASAQSAPATAPAPVQVTKSAPLGWQVQLGLEGRSVRSVVRSDPAPRPPLLPVPPPLLPLPPPVSLQASPQLPMQMPWPLLLLQPPYAMQLPPPLTPLRSSDPPLFAGGRHEFLKKMSDCLGTLCISTSQPTAHTLVCLLEEQRENFDFLLSVVRKRLGLQASTVSVPSHSSENGHAPSRSSTPQNIRIMNFVQSQSGGEIRVVLQSTLR